MGTAVVLKGPAGSFSLDADETRPAVFIAGGVGIAPFLSMLRQAEHNRSPRPLYLFYSNHEVSDAAYLHQLDGHLSSSPLRLKFVPTITGNADSGWTGERGRIGPDMLRRYLPSTIRPVYYVAGPSQFVSGMISALTAIDVGEADVQVEDFGEV